MTTKAEIIADVQAAADLYFGADPGCSEVREIALGMGLSHVTSALRKHLDEGYRAHIQKFVTDAMRELGAANEELRSKHVGMPMAEFNRVWGELRAQPKWAQARADEEAYQAANREALAQVETIDIYRMDASRVIRGWASATAPDADPDACDQTLPLPMRHLATLMEFGVLFDPRVESFNGSPASESAVVPIKKHAKKK